MAGRTSILIAHRLQTIQEADHVLVLAEGRVQEYGSHESLLAADGLYKTLHDLQFQDAASINSAASVEEH
jgi:ABC-type multidrug transport system fused ATPase/permease subunit